MQVRNQMQICPKCSQNNTLNARTCIHCGSPLPFIPLLAKGTILNNRYIVMHVLGFGGFGAVYLALDQRLNNRKVAVKELLQTEPSIVQQFETEAKILATLSHPALPKAYDWFKQFGSDRYYLVMEFIDGVNLWNLVRQEGIMKPLIAMQIFDPVLDAVAYLHNQNPPIIHRDIKPSNILLTGDRKVYLVDFGIAKVGGSGQKTATGAQGVTPGFSPPEQYLGSGETDVRSDIYSLGATLYFMLTAKVLPDATERLQKEMARQLSLEPIRSINTAVSPQVEQAIFIAMALWKEQRFNSVNDFRAGLKGQTMLIQLPVVQPMPQMSAQPASTPMQQPTPPQMVSPQLTPQIPSQPMPGYPPHPKPISGQIPSLLPKPRSFAATMIKAWTISTPLFTIPLTIVFSAMVYFSGEIPPFGEILRATLICGLIYGFFMGLISAYFFRGEIVIVEVADKEDFVFRLNIAMFQLGYNPASQTEDFFTYKPSLRAGLVADRISVQIQGRRAVIVGPKMHLEELLKRLVTK